MASPYTASTTGFEPTSRSVAFTVRLRTGITTTPPVTTIVGGVKLQPDGVHVGVPGEVSTVVGHGMVRSSMVLLFAMTTGSKLLVTAYLNPRHVPSGAHVPVLPDSWQALPTFAVSTTNWQEP